MSLLLDSKLYVLCQIQPLLFQTAYHENSKWSRPTADLSILNTTETELRTIQIKTPTSFLDLGKFEVLSVHAYFAGKNLGLSQSAIKHSFTFHEGYFTTSVIAALFSRYCEEFNQFSSNFHPHPLLQSLMNISKCINYLHTTF